MKTLALYAFFLTTSVSVYVSAQPHDPDSVVAYLVKAKNQPPPVDLTIDAEKKAKLDGLIEDAKNAEGDSLRALTLDAISLFYYENNDLDNAKRFSDSVLLIANRTKNNYILHLAVSNLGIVWYIKGNYQEALRHYQKALDAITSANVNEDLRARYQVTMFNNLGATAQLLNELESGLKFYLQGIEKATKIQDTTNLLSLYYNLGYVYSDMNQWNQCYYYTKQTIAFLRSDFQMDLVCLSRLASVCLQLGKTEEAKTYLERAEKYFLKYPNDLSKLNLHNALGQYARYFKNFRKAEELFLQAYREATQYGDPYWVAVQARELGILYLTIRNFNEAKHFF